MNKKRLRKGKKLLSWILCMVMILSVLTGLPIKGSVTEVEAVGVTVADTGYASAEDITTWKFLFVVPKTTTGGTNSAGQACKGDTLSDADIQLYVNYIIPNFEACIYEYSNHYMKVESTIITLETLEGSIGEDGILVPDSNDIKAAIASGTGVKTVYGTLASDLKTYDQIVCSFAPSNSTDPSLSLNTNYGGLGGGRFADFPATGYCITLAEKGMWMSEAEKAYKTEGFSNGDGTMKYYYATELIVHEFMHCLEFYVKYKYPEGVKRTMPSPDGCWKYYKNKSGFSLMNNFYRNFFQGTVPVKKGSKTKFGMQVEDYSRTPSTYQTKTIGSVTVNSLSQWNDAAFAIAMGAGNSGTVITLGNNIDATGKIIYNIPEFTGTLNGNGYAILGASLKNGLIGNNRGTVKNLFLLYATLSNKTGQFIGLIANGNYGTITSCGTSGTMTAKNVCGGLVGDNKDGGKIQYCFNGANVNAVKGDYFVGGIVGQNIGTVTGCFNYGIISTSLKNKSTLAIGPNYGMMTMCYTLENSAVEAGAGVSVKTAEEMAGSTFLGMMNSASSNKFEKGNGYPTIAGAKYSFMTTAGSTKKLAGESATPDAVMYVGGTAVKFTNRLKANPWKSTARAKKNGSLVWIVKNEPTELEFNTTTHKLLTKTDKTLATVAKGKVTAKKPGKVYVYAVDTGTMSAECFVVKIKPAPTNVCLYYSDDADPTEGETDYRSISMPAGGNVTVYVKGTTGSITKKANTMAVIEDSDITYTCTVPKAYQPYVTVTQDVQDQYKYTIDVSEDIQDMIMNGKKRTVTLTFKCDVNNKKTTYKLVIGNPVKTFTLAGGDNTTFGKDSSEGISCVTLDSAVTAAKTGYVVENKTLFNPDRKTTDVARAKIIRLPSKTGYKFTNSGGIKVVGSLSTQQKKVTIAGVKGKPDTYKITAKKGTAAGTTAYFMFYYNSYSGGEGYKIIKVVVGEAEE